MTGNDIIATGTRTTRHVGAGRHRIVIGAQDPADELNTMRISDSVFVTRIFASGIRNQPTCLANTKPLLINVVGQIGAANSAHRGKGAAADIAAVKANPRKTIVSLDTAKFDLNTDGSITPSDVLRPVPQMPVTQRCYRTEQSGTCHVGRDGGRVSFGIRSGRKRQGHQRHRRKSARACGDSGTQSIDEQEKRRNPIAKQTHQAP